MQLARCSIGDHCGRTHIALSIAVRSRQLLQIARIDNCLPLEVLMKLLISTCALTLIGILANLHQGAVHTERSSTDGRPVMALDDCNQDLSLTDVGAEFDSDGNVTWSESDGSGGAPKPSVAPAVVDCGSSTPAVTAGTKGTGNGPTPVAAGTKAYNDAQSKLLAAANFVCVHCPVPGACGRITLTFKGGWVIKAVCANDGSWNATATYTGAYLGACSGCPG
jgi:hypothetical protein